MNDINFITPAGGFSVRTAAVILRGSEVLLCHYDGGPDNSFWFLPGGRVQLFESAALGLARELREEIDAEVTCGPLLWISENSFPAQQVPTHELVFYFSATLSEDAPLLHAQQTVAGTEPGSRLSFAWVERAGLGDIDLRPATIKDRLMRASFRFEHLVTLDDG
jgi:ADP-ribose pyrophosphatase YjhB (NUDIX family)